MSLKHSLLCIYIYEIKQIQNYDGITELGFWVEASKSPVLLCYIPEFHLEVLV